LFGDKILKKKMGEIAPLTHTHLGERQENNFALMPPSLFNTLSEIFSE